MGLHPLDVRVRQIQFGWERFSIVFYFYSIDKWWSYKKFRYPILQLVNGVVVGCMLCSLWTRFRFRIPACSSFLVQHPYFCKEKVPNSIPIPWKMSQILYPFPPPAPAFFLLMASQHVFTWFGGSEPKSIFSMQ